MLTVSMLSTYLYCKRKLYLQKVLKLQEPERQDAVLGTIRHETYDLINRHEQAIVTSIQRKVPQEILHELYKQHYSEHLRNAIRVHKERLHTLGINPGEVFKKLWPLVMQESITRADNIYNFIETNLVFGSKLWELLTPKIISEFSVVSEALDLVGKIDQVEHWKEGFVPVEIKTGSPPQEGIWPGHRIQVIAYAMLLEEHYKKPVKEGFVLYLASHQKRHVAINPFMKHELLEMIEAIKQLLARKNLPDHTPHKKKCDSCGLREQCYNETLLGQSINVPLEAIH